MPHLPQLSSVLRGLKLCQQRRGRPVIQGGANATGDRVRSEGQRGLGALQPRIQPSKLLLGQIRIGCARFLLQ